MRKISLLVLIIFYFITVQSQVLISEDFNGTTVPSAWSAGTNTGDYTWTFGSGVVPGNVNDFTTNAAIFDDDAAGNTGEINNAYLKPTGIFHLSDYDSDIYKLQLTYDYAFNQSAGEVLYVQAHNGYTWTNIAEYDEDTNPTTEVLDISDFFVSNLSLAFQFNDLDGGFGWGAGIDNVELRIFPKNDSYQTAFWTSADLPNYTQTIDAIGATNNDGFIFFEDGTGMNDGVWYRINDWGDFDYNISVSPNAWDPEIGLFKKVGDVLEEVLHIDNNGAGGTENASFTASFGETYYINIGYYSATNDNPEGEFTINITNNCTPITITSQPQDVDAETGDNISLTTNFTGDYIDMQWEKEGVNMNEYSNVLTINNVEASDAGRYGLHLMALCGNDVYSNLATLSVCSTPEITEQPTSQFLCSGGNATFTVLATGDGLNYQWRKAGINITGANSNTYTVNSVSSGNSGNYDCFITGDCGNATSNTAQLSITAGTEIIDQPQDVDAEMGDNISFSVVAQYNVSSYQWRKDGDNISGANSSTYSINNVENSDAGNYDVVVNGACDSPISDIAILSVCTSVAITTQPEDVDVEVGTNVVFAVATTGTDINYQWKKDGTNITGEQNFSLYLTSVQASDAGDYTVVVSNSCSNITSETALLSICIPVEITSQPEDINAQLGDNISFSVSATGSDFNYQWMKDDAIIVDEENNSLEISNVQASDAGDYTVVVSNSCSNITSETALLSICIPVEITSQPEDINAQLGDNISFSVSATGSDFNYQWMKDDAIIVDEENNSLEISNVQASDAGDYTVVVSNSCSSLTSNTATLDISTVINHVLTTNIKIYPNPTTNIINFESDIIIDRIEIIDISGRLILSGNVNNNNYSMSLSELNAGIYTVRIYGNNGINSYKIIKQ